MGRIVQAWNRYSAGDGAKGRRDYDWAWIAVIPPADEATGFHWLLIRRRISDGELAFYRCHAPTRVGLPALVRVAGTRWAIECCFQNAKGAVGLDQHQVRRWDSWHRYTTLVMLAAAILTAIAANERRRATEPGLIPLTVTEIRRLFAKLITTVTRPASFLPPSQQVTSATFRSGPGLRVMRAPADRRWAAEALPAVPGPGPGEAARRGAVASPDVRLRRRRACRRRW
jgi:hypothetical protein